MGNHLQSYFLAGGLYSHGKVAAKFCLPGGYPGMAFPAIHRAGVGHSHPHDRLPFPQSGSGKPGEGIAIRIGIIGFSPAKMPDNRALKIFLKIFSNGWYKKNFF